jgi:ubiquinone/menaquinone biosynthesis C-methylase UbiE
MTTQPHGAGKSSFDLVELPKLLELLDLKKGDRLVDIGCGRGAYSLALAPFVGPEGKIIAVDLWEEGIEHLAREIESRNIKNVEPKIADATKSLPVEDGWADVCFSSTVFHDLVHAGGHEKTLEEIKRILKPDGVFDLIEFQKIDGPPGPPIEIRIGPEELGEMLAPFGFEFRRVEVLEPYLYFAEFSILKQQG